MSKTISSVRLVACLLISTLMAPLALAAPDSVKKPNIVLVLMDNFGYGEPGVYGGGEIRGAPTQYPKYTGLLHITSSIFCTNSY